MCDSELGELSKISGLSTSRKVLQKVGKVILENVHPIIDSKVEKLGTNYVSTPENWLGKL